MKDIKIKIIIKNKGPLLANANVMISTLEFGPINLKDFQIWNSNEFNSRLGEKINIQPPGAMVYQHYRQKVFFEDSQSWFLIEHEIYHTYLAQVNKQSDDDVNPDDVPF